MSKTAFFAISALAASANGTPFRVKPSQSRNHGKEAYISKLVSKAQVTRKLNEDYQPDISGYSLVFEKCQMRKQLALDECDNDVGSCMEIQKFAIFKLCKSCSDCSYDYGEYLIDLDTYLQMTVEFYQDEFENYCNLCEENCEQDEDNRKLEQYYTNCNTCQDECYKAENMEENGYMDAAELLECQQVFEDDYGNAYYAGPTCASNGEKIKIGAFIDEQCTDKANVDPSDIMKDGDGYPIKLSYKILKKAYTDTCISCTAFDWDAQNEDEDNNNNNNNDNDEEEEIEVTEVCQELYQAAAKCESNHGFDATYNWYSIYYDQAAQEDTICTLISNLQSNTYDSSGEINIYPSKTRVITESTTTMNQKIAVGVLALATIGLAAWAASLHSKLNSTGNSGLSQQGGTMS